MWFSPAPQDQYRSLTRGVLSGTGSGNRSQIGPPAGTGAMSCARRTEVMRSSLYSAPTSSISSGPDSYRALRHPRDHGDLPRAEPGDFIQLRHELR